MPRNGGSADVVWFETDPCYVFHPMNAYTDGRRVIADVCRYPRVPLFDGEESVEGLEKASRATLTRWTLDLDLRTVKSERIDDLPTEFPRLDERRAGLPYRHGYAAGRVGSTTGGGPFDTIVHYDFRTEGRKSHDFGDDGFPSEPIFVPCSPDAKEGEGFLLTVVYRQSENRSDLVILDAENIEKAPLAVAKLPHRVPYGFHGNWASGL
jgi:carotenoid cleavage dioxygenase